MKQWYVIRNTSDWFSIDWLIYLRFFNKPVHQPINWPHCSIVSQCTLYKGWNPVPDKGVWTPNSGHFLLLLLPFSSDSAHTGLNRTEIIPRTFRNQERYSFQSLNINKTLSKSEPQKSRRFFILFETDDLINFKWKIGTSLASTMFPKSYPSIYLGLGWISWEVKKLFMSGIGSPHTFARNWVPTLVLYLKDNSLMQVSL